MATFRTDIAHVVISLTSYVDHIIVNIYIISNLYILLYTSFFYDMRITIHQLNVFQQVAKLGSVTQAAHALHMTQPAVSNILRQLEEFYDAKLTEVIGRKLSLTAFGKILLRNAQEIELMLNATKTEIELLKGGLSGTLKLATVSTARYFVPRLLGLFKTKYPEVHVILTVCNRHQIITRLNENMDDFVIMSHPPSTFPVDCAEFLIDELVIAAAKESSHPRGVISLSSLKNDAWIIREEGSGTRYAMDTLFKKHRFHPQIEMEISDGEAIKQAIIANMGLSVVSKHSIKLELQQKLIRSLRVKGFPIKHTWYLVKNKNKTLPPVAHSFYQFVKHKKPVFKDI